MSASRPDEASRRRGVPEATVARLPLYLRALTALADRSVATVSSEELAALAGVSPAKLRKDLSFLGSYGTRGVGYDVGHLVDRVAAELGLTRDRGVVLVGVGNLGSALAGYAGFASRGFRIVGLFDADPRVVGRRIGDLTVRPVAELARCVADEQATIGVIATPAPAAPAVAAALVAAGVTSVLNFAPVLLEVPPEVEVRQVDLASELAILAFHERQRDVAAVAAVAAGGTQPAHARIAARLGALR